MKGGNSRNPLYQLFAIIIIILAALNFYFMHDIFKLDYDAVIMKQHELPSAHILQNSSLVDYLQSFKTKYSNREDFLGLTTDEKLNICKTWSKGVGLFDEEDTSKGFKPSIKKRIHFLFLFVHEAETGNYCSIESLIRILCKYDKTEFEIFFWSTRKYREIRALKSIKALVAKEPSITLVEKEFMIHEVISGTPLEQFYGCLEYFEAYLGDLEDQNIANAARIAILYKYGGYYFDLDMIFIKDFLHYRSGFGEEAEDLYNTAFLYFDKESSKPFLFETMLQFARRYEPKWGYNGPVLLQHIVHNHCKRTDSQLACSVYSVDTILEVYPPNEVYPIHWSNKMEFLEVYEDVRRKHPELDSALMLHVYHHITRSREITMCRHQKEKYKRTYIGTMRKKYCPQTFELLLDKCVV